jgi:hypothetical protein
VVLEERPKVHVQRGMRPSLSCRLYVFERAWGVRAPFVGLSGDDR